MSASFPGAVIQSTHERMEECAKVAVPKNLVDSIITEGVNVVYAYTDTGKSYFARRVMYHCACDARIPGVQTDLKPGEHLKVLYIDPEQHNANLKGFLPFHHRLSQHDRELINANTREIRSPDGFTHNLRSFIQAIQHAMKQGTHTDLVIVDGFQMIWGRQHNLGNAAEMEGMLGEMFKDLKGAKSLLLIGQVTRAAFNQMNTVMPGPAGSTKLEEYIQGNLVFMGKPKRDPYKRFFVHRKQKLSWGKKSYHEHLPSFVLVLGDEEEPFYGELPSFTYAEWNEQPESNDPLKIKLQQAFERGDDMNAAIDIYISERPCKRDSARRRISDWGFDFKTPLAQRPSQQKLIP